MSSVREVADRANVSVAAVSMVLNRPSKVSPRTRERIEKAMRQLGYRPRRPGRPASRQPKSDQLRIGIICPGLKADGKHTPLFVSFVLSAQDTIEKEGHLPTLLTGGSDFSHDPVAQHLLSEGNIDGVVLAGISANDGYLERVLQEGIPCVVINRRAQADEFSYVTQDNAGGGRQVAEHLYRLGHRRIAYVHPLVDVMYVKERLTGLRLGLKKYGIEPVAVEAMQDSASHEQRLKQAVFIAKKLLSMNVTAVFTTFDKYAILMIEALESLGVSVPAQVSVVGFDDRGVQSPTGLQPTSIAFDREAIGRTAVEILISIMDAKSSTQFTAKAVETWLVERDTTAPAPVVDGVEAVLA